MLTLSNGTTVQGASGSPALADTVVAAVAQTPAYWACPLLLLLYLQDVLTIPHEQAVPTQHTLQSGHSSQYTCTVSSCTWQSTMAGPLLFLYHQNVLTIPHEQAVTTQHTLQAGH